MEILLSLRNNNFFRDDNFLEKAFKKNEFIFEKSEDLFKMFRRQGLEFHENNVNLAISLFDVFKEIANDLNRNEKYNAALSCYSYADYICGVLLLSVKPDERGYWEKQRETLVENKQLINAIIVTSELKNERLDRYDLDKADVKAELFEHAI